MAISDRSVPIDAVRCWVVRAGLAVFAILLVANLGKLFHYAWFAQHYPYDLDYGEGIVWQQMRNIVAGIGYGPISVYPSIVYHYPPVYHLTTAAFAVITGLDQLAAGRLLSFLSTLAMMLLVGLLAAAAIPKAEGRFVRIGAATIAGLCLVNSPEITGWASIMRVDMLATALSLAGLLLSVHAMRRPWLIVPAAFAFVLAIYAKQTMVAAPAAAFAGLLLARPHVARSLAALCLAIGLVALAGLSIETRGGFLQHIILYNINRLDLERAAWLAQHLAVEIVFLVIAAFAVRNAWHRLRPTGAETWRQRLASDPAHPALATILIFFALKILMMPMILKSGSADNYLIEWICALAILVGIGLVPVLAIARGGDTSASIVLIALVVLGLPLTAAQMVDATPSPAILRRHLASMEDLVARIRAAPKPVISDDMILLIRAGKAVMWEPSIEAELAGRHRYDEQAFARMVRRGDFAFFITHGLRGHRLFDERYNPVVADAMDAAYPRLRKVSGVTLHLPAN